MHKNIVLFCFVLFKVCRMLWPVLTKALRKASSYRRSAFGNISDNVVSLS